MLSLTNYKFIYGLLFSILYLCVNAQQTILLNQASFNLFTLSPAAIGLNSDITANCHYKKNWLGMVDSPELMQVSIDGPVSKNKYALGLNLINEKAGIFSKTYLSGAFRYKVKLAKDHHLLFGISAGFQRQLSDFSKIKADAPEEFAYWPQQQAVTIPDAAVGLVYTFKKLIVTLSANQLLQQAYSYREPVYNKSFQYKTVSHFIIALQNTFTLKPETWFYTPQITIRTPQGLPMQFDFVNTLNYKNKLLFGVGYRHFYALYGNLGYCVTDKLRVIYSYEYSYGIQSITKGGHELGLTFGLFNKNTKSKQANETSNRTLDEIFEKLDKHDQLIEGLTTKTDSLDKNLSLLKSELDILKSKQVDQTEISKAIETYLTHLENTKKHNNDSTSEKTKTNKVNQAKKYKVISPRSEKDFVVPEESISSNYKIVLGVYQLSTYAIEYQKFLKRELSFETTLLQLADHPKKFIYVCKTIEFSNLKQALEELKKTRAEVKLKSLEITKGEAWILQTLNPQ